MHVVVIGAGVIGVTTAYALRQHGCEVTVLERGSGVAQGASFANGGVISHGYAGPWAAPGVPMSLLRALFQRDASLRLRLRIDPALAEARAAQLRAKRPDIRIVEFRGNVDTRLEKLNNGVADATFLALAGLKRLGKASVVSAILEPTEMLPAVAQGAVGIECRLDDRATRQYLAAIDHADTHIAVRAERGLLERLDGSCRTPIGALAILDGKGGLRLDGLVVRPDGTGLMTTFREGRIADAEAMGRDAGEELKRRAGPGYFAV